MKKIRWVVIALTLAIVVLFAFWQKRDATPASIDFDVPRKAEADQVIEVPLRISSSVAMNAAEFYFSFPPELLEVTTIDQGGSFFSLWIKEQPSFDNQLGQLSLAGGLPRPGFVGKDGLVATVRFRTKKAGSGQIQLDTAKSRILANDGLGSPIEAAFAPVSFTIE